MPQRLKELIRAVRLCKTAQEERDVIAKESAYLRNAARNGQTSKRPRDVAKLIYIHMLGYPTHFGQLECLKLIAANDYPAKRMGYLGLMILLDERQEVLMLVTNSLKQDLNSKNQYVVGIALAALANICSTEMARDLSPDVEKLLQSTNPYIRKKAALCAMRVVKKVPEMVELYVEKAVTLLNDRSHAVLLAGVALMIEVCQQDAAAIVAYRKHVPRLCSVLKSLLLSGFAPEYDVAGVNDPYLQVKILRLLCILGKGDAEASDAMSDVLAQVASGVEPVKHAGNAILYEAVQTIMGTESMSGLRVLAINIMGRFLGQKDNNMRYVALNTLARVVAVDNKAVQRHGNTIVECVKDNDVSIRRRALELVYALVSDTNIETLSAELLDYLSNCDEEFKPDLANRISLLVQRFAPNRRWHVDTMLKVMVKAGAYVKEEVVRALIVLITNSSDLHGYTARTCYSLLQQHRYSAAVSLLVTCCWCIGEFGDLLTSNAGLLDGESPVSVSPHDVVELLTFEIGRSDVTADVRAYVLTALMKLSTRMPDEMDTIRSAILKYSTSVQLEVQQRAFEYSRMFVHDALRPQLMERMPALNELQYTQNLGNANVVEAAAAAQAVQQGDKDAANDILSLIDIEPSSDAAGGAAHAATLDDLLGPTVPVASATGDAGSGAAGLLDLLDTTPIVSPAAAPQATLDPLADIFGVPSPTTPPPAAAAASHPPFTVLQKHGIHIQFACSKPANAPTVTDIKAVVTNSTAAPATDFSLQAAVPKFMEVRLEPATGTTIPPNNAGKVEQDLHVTNNMHGQKPLAMRLRVAFTLNGQAVLEQVQVSNFPAGL